MEDKLRVTMIATGLGGATTKARQPRLEVVEQLLERTGTDGLAPSTEPVDYDRLEKTPAVIRRGRAPAANGAPSPGFDPSAIPAFLRKQAD
jgi:cell division protein FtsZ